MLTDHTCNRTLEGVGSGAVSEPRAANMSDRKMSEYLANEVPFDGQSG